MEPCVCECGWADFFHWSTTSFFLPMIVGLFCVVFLNKEWKEWGAVMMVMGFVLLIATIVWKFMGH